MIVGMERNVLGRRGIWEEKIAEDGIGATLTFLEILGGKVE